MNSFINNAAVNPAVEPTTAATPSGKPAEGEKQPVGGEIRGGGDIYERVTNMIIAQLEAGTPPWVRPWTVEADPTPVNAATQRGYRGINVLILSMAMMSRGYVRNQWLTFKQAQSIGASVRKGEHGFPVCFFDIYEKETEADDGEKQKKRFPVMRHFTVFNVAQVDDLPEGQRAIPLAPVWDPEERAEEFMKASGADIRHGSARAFYSITDDYIMLPERPAFGKRFGDEAYAMEELVAELGAAFLCAASRIDGKLEHASYLENWLKVLRSDRRAIFTAAAQAQKAADFVLAAAGHATAAPAEVAAAA